MPSTITLSDLPDPLLEAIRQRAGLRGRSIQSEIRDALEQTFLPRKLPATVDPVTRFVEGQRNRLATGELPRPPRPVLLLLRGRRDESDAAVLNGFGSGM
jgi:plasmid stability protein